MNDNIEQIKKQAEYCLHCKTKPCKTGCPLQNNIPDFIAKIKEEKYEEAYNILSETTVFEVICGRICPHQSQCEGKCIRGIKGQSVAIGDLEAFVGDYMLEKNASSKRKQQNNNGKKIAIIGSGPAGLACAYKLSNQGFVVTIYEKHSKIGGLLRYGIPEFRLPKELLNKWLKNTILNENIQVFTNKELGKDINLEELEKEYDAIILAFGANVSNQMNIPGENLEFVLGGNELLEYRNFPNFEEKIVAVIGGGNVAMDTARTIKKLGAKEVSIIYRRAEKQMPSETKEIQAAKQEGIKFVFQTNVIRIINNENVGALLQKNTEENLPNCALNNRCCQIECIKTKLIQKPGETRLSPVNIEGSNYFFDVDYVVMAVGSHPNEKIINELHLETTKWGYLKVNENYQTSNKKIYAIGDIAGQKQTVAWAARSGFECAEKIIK